MDDELQIARLLRKKLLAKIDKKRQTELEKAATMTKSTVGSCSADSNNAVASSKSFSSKQTTQPILPYFNALTKY